MAPSLFLSYKRAPSMNLKGKTSASCVKLRVVREQTGPLLFPSPCQSCRGHFFLGWRSFYQSSLGWKVSQDVPQGFFSSLHFRALLLSSESLFKMFCFKKIIRQSEFIINILKNMKKKRTHSQSNIKDNFYKHLEAYFQYFFTCLLNITKVVHR